MADAMTEFGYAAGVEVNSYLSGAVSPLSSKLDTVISLLSSASSTSRTSAGVALPSAATLARINAIAARKQSQGMSAKTGRLLTGLDHLKQSIADILHTLIGSRVKRRTYGSNLFKRTDWPQDYALRVDLIADVAEALDKWEPRFTLKRIKLSATVAEQYNGKLFYALVGVYNGDEISIEVPA